MTEDLQIEERLCQASGIEYRIGLGLFEEMIPHSLFSWQRRDAKFCSDKCRNLFRDTKNRRFRKYVLENMPGCVPAGYKLIPNYRGSGHTVLVSEKSNRIVR